MNSYFYKKSTRINIKLLLRIISIFIIACGIIMFLYVFSPLLLWQVYFAPAFATQNIALPIPKNTVVSKGSLQSLFAETKNHLQGVNYTNAENWFPGYKGSQKKSSLDFYTLSIPKLSIQNAVVSTVDYDLSQHLVQYAGTSVPGEKGTSVIFGHSTLPQLFNPNDYKTIFANLYTLTLGDRIVIQRNTISYTYSISSIIVVDPTDTAVFSQDFDDSYITLVTCTPPGTTWKRLIIRASLQKL